MSKDYYADLGVAKGATKAEIKKAFRNKAKQHHPDKGGDEAKFKEINEAYEVLSNDQKRTQYDQFGSDGPGGAGGFGGFGGGSGMGDMGGFGDIFENFFGGGGGMGGFGQQRQSQSPVQPGRDLEVELLITFADSLRGVTKTIRAQTYVTCETCDAQGGEGRKTCSTCNGTGAQTRVMRTPLGNIQQRVTCTECSGEGQTFESTCSTCAGEGRTSTQTTLEVIIPQGIADGQTLRLRAKGEAGRRGGKAGDLFVVVRVGVDTAFERDGRDVHQVVQVPVLDALLGTEIEVETFWGTGHLSIPECTADRAVLRIPGHGVRTESQEGDALIHVRITHPKKIHKALRKALEEAQKEI